MRGLVLMFAALVACKSEESRVRLQPLPPLVALEFHGDILDQFCHDQEREPGWTCDDYENCETATVDGLAVCRPKPLAD